MSKKPNLHISKKSRTFAAEFTKAYFTQSRLYRNSRLKIGAKIVIKNQ